MGVEEASDSDSEMQQQQRQQQDQQPTKKRAQEQEQEEEEGVPVRALLHAMHSPSGPPPFRCLIPVHAFTQN